MSGKAHVRSKLKDPFIRVPREADDVQLDPYEFRVYSRLIRKAGEDGVAWQSVANMARECGMSPRKLHDALRELEARGMITAYQRPGQTTEYTINEASQWSIKPDRKKPPTSARGADVPAPTSAPDADPPLHVVQTTSARDADKGEPSKENPEKERRGRTSQSDRPRGSLTTSLSFLGQLNLALANPDTPEAKAFLHATGNDPDRRPLWELANRLKRLLGTEYTHRQVQENLEAWAGHVTLVEAHLAWEKARARYSRDTHGLKPVLHFVDILNGNYKPDAFELQKAEQAQALQAAATAAAAPQPGARVRLPDGSVHSVHDFDESGGWVILADGAGHCRASDCVVIQ